MGGEIVEGQRKGLTDGKLPAKKTKAKLAEDTILEWTGQREKRSGVRS